MHMVEQGGVLKVSGGAAIALAAKKLRGLHVDRSRLRSSRPKLREATMMDLGEFRVSAGFSTCLKHYGFGCWLEGETSKLRHGDNVPDNGS